MPIVRYVKVRLKDGTIKGYSGPRVRLFLEPEFLVILTEVGKEAFARETVESFEEREI